MIAWKTPCLGTARLWGRRHTLQCLAFQSRGRNGTAANPPLPPPMQSRRVMEMAQAQLQELRRAEARVLQVEGALAKLRQAVR